VTEARTGETQTPRARRLAFPVSLRRQATPSFAADLRLGLEEAELVRRVLRSTGVRRGTLVDVGAHVGTVTALFAPRGWTVHAFEPDPVNRQRFRERLDLAGSVHLDDRAVGETDGQVLPFYTSAVSSGISGLVPFHASHHETTEVRTVRLDTYLRQAGVESVDFLKVDTEGFDLFVLRSFPWSDLPRPAAVLCEFEDAKTTRVGYTTSDLARFLLHHGYKVLVSEWHPITRYGAVHSWRRMYPWDEAPPRSLEQAWGNLVAFSDPRAANRALDIVPELLTIRGQPSRGSLLHVNSWKIWRSWRTRY
jgi:FkbM family methyltransferase